MTALITGASGFVGQNLLRKLADRGESVVAVSRRPDLAKHEKAVSWHSLPEDTAGWTELLREISVVYHLAWSSLPQTSNENPLRDASDNILNTLRLLDAAKSKRDLQIVFPSSGGTVYGTLMSIPANEQHGTNPRCAYGISKLAVEKYLNLYRDLWGVNCIALRISNAYGPGQKTPKNFGAIATFANRAAKNDTITIFGDGTIIRDYIYIDDLTDAIIAAGAYRGDAAIMNIGSGVGKSLNDIIDTLGKYFSKKISVEYVKGRDLDIPVSVLDISLAKTALDWKPHTTFEAGIEATLRAMDAA